MSAPFTIEPAVLPLGPIQLTGFGIAVLLAFAIANVITTRELAARGHTREAEATGDVITAALVGTLVGAKLYFVILNGDLNAIFSRSGFVFWGGFMGAVAACYLTISWRKLSFNRFADVAALGIAAGYAVGRTGCWAVGDDYGKPWDGFLAVKFPHGFPPSTAGIMASQFHAQIPPGVSPADVISVHPTQLYETAMGLVMFAILWRLRGHQHKEGWLFGAYCVVAGIERLLVEIVRAKDDRLAGPLSTAQIVALGIITVGFVWMWVRRGDQPGVRAAQA